jgi:hypothetical protein
MSIEGDEVWQIIILVPGVVPSFDDLHELPVALGADDTVLISIPLVLALMAVYYLALSRGIVLHVAGCAAALE